MSQQPLYQLPPAGGYPSILKFLNRESDSLELNTTLKQQFKQEVYLTNSGKSAIFAVLLAQSKLVSSDKNRVKAKKVLIPNYCCPDLVFAIQKAGLETVLAPVKKYTLEIDQEFYKNLDSRDCLAIILPNLYGMLDSIPESIDPNILIIDDLCLSLNNIKETRTGVSVFSAGRGKAICGFGGGGIILKTSKHNSNHNSKLAKEIEKIISKFKSPSFLKDVKVLSYATLIPILENPYLFFLLNKIIKTGEVKIHFEFETNKISKFENKYASFQSMRTQEHKTIDWSKEIKSNSIIQPYLERMKAVSKTLNPISFSRYPVILENLDAKRLSRLKTWGINASYQKPLSQYEELKSFVKYDSNKDQDFLRRLVTLPTHSKVKKEHVGRILKVLV